MTTPTGGAPDPDGAAVGADHRAPLDENLAAQDGPDPESVVMGDGDAAEQSPDPENDVMADRDSVETAASHSLSPTDRVIPSWTDPTVRRASALIGGPLGRHASVGRARIFTPLRVALLMGLAVLIVGWLAKSPCIQTGPNGELDQGGQRPWITGCYNDIVPLYGSRGLDDPSRMPYSYRWIDPAGDRPGGHIFSRDDVYYSGGDWIADTGEVDTILSTGDLIHDDGSGFLAISGDTLVPATAEHVSEIRHLEYPVLTGYFMWGSAALTSQYLGFTQSTGLLPVPLDVGAYFTITAILLGLLYLWAIASTARIARRRIWDVAIMCLAPLLAVHAFTNWDIIAIAFTAAGMAAWARQRSAGGAWLAGLLLGLGIAAKLYPLFLLGPLLVLCLRAGRLRRFWCTLGGAAVSWLAVNALVFVSYPEAWRTFFTMNSARGPEWDSWYFLSTVVFPIRDWWSDSSGQATALLNGLSLGLFILACAGIGWLALAASSRPRFAQLAFLVVTAFLLTNKVFSPQYSLWLLPLVTLALPRWRRVLAWELSEVAVWFLLMLTFDTDASNNLSIEPFAVAAVVRDVLLIALAVRVIREILRPELDLVRRAGDDDPSGGVLEGAPDRFVLPSLRALWRRSQAEHPVPAPAFPSRDPL